MSEPVDPQVLDALRRRRTAAVPAEARVRVERRLAALLPGTSDVVGGTGGPSPSRAPGWSSVARIGSRTLLASTFVLGGAAGAGLHAAFVHAPPARVVYVERPASSAPAIPDVERAAAQAPGASPQAEPSARSEPSSPTTQTVYGPLPRAEARTLVDGGGLQLDAERALLDDARAAIAHRNTSRALDLLAQHARTYARPILVEEREALEIEALVAATRYSDAKVRAAEFRRKNPTSLFLPAVDSALAAIP